MKILNNDFLAHKLIHRHIKIGNMFAKTGNLCYNFIYSCFFKTKGY